MKLKTRRTVALAARSQWLRRASLRIGATTVFACCLATAAACEQAMNGACTAAEKRVVRAAELRRALNSGDPDGLALVIRRLACLAPEPDTEIDERYIDVDPWSARLSQTEVEALARRYFADLDRDSVWWDKGLRPDEIPGPLRQVAEYIRAMLIVDRYLAGVVESPVDRARRAGDYLLKAQTEAAAGLFPFPAWRGKSDERLHELSERFLSRMERDGRLAEVTRNGWVISDLGGGGLGFDNGLAGEALILLYERTGDRRYLDGAIKAGDWALAQPISENFNYNGFPALLAANLFRATGERRYLGAALGLAKTGVMSGQRRGGPYDGNWIDPHNARLNYRYLMMRQLLGVLEASAAAGVPDPDVTDSIVRGLRALESQQLQNGGLGNIFSASEAYCDLYLRHDASRTFARWPSGIARMTIAAGIDALRSGQKESPIVVACSLAMATLERLP